MCRGSMLIVMGIMSVCLQACEAVLHVVNLIQRAKKSSDQTFFPLINCCMSMCEGDDDLLTHLSVEAGQTDRKQGTSIDAATQARSTRTGRKMQGRQASSVMARK